MAVVGWSGMADRMDWQAFWPFYLGEHNVRRNRYLHVFGTTLGLAFLVAALVTAWWWALLIGLVSAYLFAWIGHFVIQKNRPATFKYPIKSFAYDWRLWFLSLTRRADAEYEKHGIEQQ